MIGCLRTRVREQPIIALYFESENELKFYNLEAWSTVVQLKKRDWIKISCAGAFVKKFPKQLSIEYFGKNNRPWCQKC